MTPMVSGEPVVKINHFKLMKMVREKNIKSYTLRTKRELLESLSIEKVDNKIRSKRYIFIKNSDAKQFTFRIRKEAMDFFRTGGHFAKGTKNKRLAIDSIECRFERH